MSVCANSRANNGLIKSLAICPHRTYSGGVVNTNYPESLTPAVFHILLALAKGERHGYEIMKTARQDSDGRVRMGNGTLYGSLKRMLSHGLIEDAGERAGADDTRRRYYRLTSRGRDALEAEAERYLNTTRAIRNYKLAPNSF